MSVVLVLVVAGCSNDGTATSTTQITGGSATTGGSSNTIPGSTTAPGQTTPPDEMVEPLATYQVMEVYDPMINGFLAATFVVPAGWGYQGGIHWEPNLRPLAAAMLQVSDPTGAYGLQTYFPVQYGWTSEPFGQNLGANWLGSIMSPTRSAGEAVLEFVVPQVRSNYQVVSVIPVQPPLQPQQPGEGYDAVRVRIEYDTPGGRMEEDFHGLTQYLRAQVGPNSFIDNWGFASIYSMRAPVGQLDSMLPTLELIMASMQLDLRWMTNYLDVYAMFQQRGYESIQLAAELSQTITRTYEEIGQIYRDTWAEQQASRDRIHENFTDYIRDTQRVQTQSGGVLRLGRGIACQRTLDGTILILPDGSICPINTVRLPQAP